MPMFVSRKKFGMNIVSVIYKSYNLKNIQNKNKFKYSSQINLDRMKIGINDDSEQESAQKNGPRSLFFSLLGLGKRSSFQRHIL